MTEPDDARRPIPRREWLVLALVLLVALTARAWRLDATSMDHYDEGVYAFSAWGLSDADRPMHPEQRNSPALHSWVTSLAFRLAGGPSDLLMLGVNVVLGTLTILVVWAVARRWFGAATAIGAATLLALNEYHIALSRSGLTDVVFAIAFVLAIAAVIAAIERPRVLVAVGAGLLVGLAWNAKYHGWLSVVVVTSGLVPWALGLGWRVADYVTAVRQLAVITVVAMACYAPWALFLIDQFGSYAQATAYQMTFLSREWPANFVRQVGQQLYFDGVLTHVSLPAALVAMAGVQPVWPSTTRWLAALSVGAAAAALAGGTPLVWALTAAAIPALIAARRLPAWTVLAWGAILVVLTPVYNPYARLVLPFTIATALAAAYALSRWPLWQTSTSPKPAWQAWAVAGILVLAVAASAVRERDEPTRWRRTRSLPDAVAEIAARVEPGASVFVMGEAALAFHLELAGFQAFKGFEYPELLEKEGREQYVVTGYYTRRAASLRDGLARLAPRLEQLATYEFVPTDFRLLDSFQPDAARAFLRSPDDRYELTLYRYRPDVPLVALP
jgi:4-amino-4-deoxy-L-arabinose transferase-like glycosyltransferase